MLFLVALFLLKTTPIFKNTVSFVQGNQENGLTAYDNMTFGDLVNKDTDGDGILDWEELLYGLDPTKKETAPGTPDSMAIEKLKMQQVQQELSLLNNDSTGNQGTEKLTQTEKFSRELFATVAATSQNGVMDQATIDALGASLAEKIENPIVRKVFSTSDLNIIKDDSLQAIKNYMDAVSKIEAKYPIKGNVANILEKFIADENNVNLSALAELDLIIKPLQNGMDEAIKMNVPQSLVSLHLDSLNGLERVIENLNDIKLFDTDPILALGAISQYDKNATLLESAAIKLMNAVIQKLKN
ncbi:MAG: thrombospondin type 3 repeat-containing protein [bacterium]